MMFDYARAIKKIIREELRGNNPIPDILSFQNLTVLYKKNLFEQLDDLFYIYRDTAKNSCPLLRIDVPKPNFTIRPMSRPEKKDWILLEAIVDSMASKIILKPKVCKRSFSFLNFHPDTETENNWIKFDDKCRELYANGFKYAVTADITGFYENINLGELKKRLINYLDNDKETVSTINVLIKLLTTWSDERVSGFGLPQGPPASGFLADVYLDLVDSKMERYENYYRYMDDIRIFCKTEIEAKKALKDLIIALRGIKLNINAKKTKILHDKDINGKLFDPLKLMLNAIATVINGKNKSQISQIVSSLQDIFEGAFVDDPFEKPHINFSLYRLGLLHSSGFTIEVRAILSLIKNNSIRMPHHTGLFCFFLTLFPKNGRLVNFLMDFLMSEHNIYEWQEVKILQALLRFNIQLEPSEVNFLIASAKDSEKHYVSRAFYFLLAGKHCDNRDRELLVECYDSQLHSYVKQAIILAVQELGGGSRNAFYAQIKKYETNEELIQFVDYVKSLKSPLYCLDIRKPSIEGLEEMEPSPYF